ncbi:MAG: hypothetical protein WKF87_21720 [Chryseolinea sp.]
MKTTNFTVLFVLLVIVAQAQNYAFKVLANKGTNEVKSGADWVPLKTGASLKAGDELRLSENAYVGLVHSSGKPLEVKKSGSHKVAILESQVKTGSGILTKYTDFILTSNSPEAKKNRLSATGAVDRGETYAIKVALPENQYSGIYNNRANVSWDGSEIGGPYTVTIKNMFDDTLSKFETSGTSVLIDLNDAKFSKENAILIDVKSKLDPKLASKPHMIKRLPVADQVGVKKSLTEINGDVKEETALNKFILAGFYEQQNLFIDAIVAYNDAIKLAPEVGAFQEAYDDFLGRNGMK